MDLRGDMNLTISDPANSKLTLALAEFDDDHVSDLQFKQHPNVAKWTPESEKIIAMKDSNRGFPIGQALAVLKWRYTGKDERWVPLTITCWPTPSGEGTCDVNIEYELELSHLTLHNVVISIPLPPGSYPTVTSHSGTWALNPSTHAIDWSLPLIASDADTKTGTLEFNVGGDDVEAFFPVKASFVAQGSLGNIQIASVDKVSGGAVPFSHDPIVHAGEYLIV